MQQTMQLLEKALTVAPMPVWTKKLSVHRNALSNAKSTGHLTPVLAGLLAIELGEDAPKWMQAAVIEGERDSPAKRLLQKKLEAMRTWSIATIKGILTKRASRAGTYDQLSRALLWTDAQRKTTLSQGK